MTATRKVFNFATGETETVELTPEEIARDAEIAALHAAANPPRWSPLEFLERFTQAERIAIRTAASGTSPEALQLADWLDLLRASMAVISNDPRTVAGMGALVSAGLLSEQRKTEILTA